jgi:hypothetical protein
MSESPRPPGKITKGVVHTKVEALVNRNPEARRRFLAALKDWKGKPDYLQILVDHAGLTPKDAAYLRNTWYSQDGWWPEQQPVESIVRHSLIKALELATLDPDTGRERDLPVDSYWLCVGDAFEVILISSDQQITRLILTPPGPSDAAVNLRNLTARGPLWVIRRSSDAERPGEERLGEIVEHVEGEDQVVTIRLKAAP